MRRISIRSFLAAGLILLLSGCVQDATETRKIVGDGSVDLSVSMPYPVQKSMGTRAVEADFDRIDYINIIIAEGDTDASKVLASVHFAPAEGPDEVGVEYAANGNGFNIHFTSAWLTELDLPEGKTFYIVANRNAAVPVGTTVKEMRGLKEFANPDGTVRVPCMMFAKAEMVDGNHGHAEGESMAATLERTVAMITVAIEAEDLNPNVTITPLSVSLHNVPTSCVLDGQNIVTLNVGEIDPLPGAVAANGEAMQAGDLGWGAIRNGSSVGGHYNDTYSNAGVMPMFLYENYHGEGFGVVTDNQAEKRPAAAASALQSDVEAVSATCSYLEVRAMYQYGDDFGGEVSYRVFIGNDDYEADIFDNFDVMRNHYYQFTLTLSSVAAQEGGQVNGNGDFRDVPFNATWRVKTNLSEESLLSERNFTLNSGGEAIIINELLPKGGNSNIRIEYQGPTQAQVNGSEYIWIMSGQNGDGAWSRFNNVKKLLSKQPNGNIQLRFYVEPFIQNPPQNNRYMREVTFRITDDKDYTSDWITITQYAPVPSTVNRDECSAELQDYVENVLKRAFPLNILVDRVDRNAAPWGFNGTNVAANSDNGFTNGNTLLNMGAGNAAPASQYLPFGSPNSAMMHAAFMNYYQRATTPPGFTGNPATLPTIANMRAAYTPSAVVPNAIPSRAEWKLVEMLYDEGFEVFDDRHMTAGWYKYWTSDAVEGDQESYSYQLGQNLDNADNDNWPGQYVENRTAAVRYRMINIR